ncbi:hypothetical protein GH742_08065 [Legionella sp. MW5194]|uniref:BufA2 family periplasmic bufferin-type metallophore n=1 Tax=Legionella sp. MW5194 TaxID=2662448 RepID=UPI00193DA162|nr:hypothetical protein [Legionella sp. MW5194]QRN03833.1 hypothetical protein GH742_08065 [Legionella sp. MW5194]
MNKLHLTGAALAMTAAAAFSLIPSVAAADTASATVKCQGVNACKGLSNCKTSENACKGQNSCKGKGYVDLTAEQCKQVGGKAE